jgi:hypothetical protein
MDLLLFRPINTVPLDLIEVFTDPMQTLRPMYDEGREVLLQAGAGPWVRWRSHVESGVGLLRAGAVDAVTSLYEKNLTTLSIPAYIDPLGDLFVQSRADTQLPLRGHALIYVDSDVDTDRQRYRRGMLAPDFGPSIEYAGPLSDELQRAQRWLLRTPGRDPFTPSAGAGGLQLLQQLRIGDDSLIRAAIQQMCDRFNSGYAKTKTRAGRYAVQQVRYRTHALTTMGVAAQMIPDLGAKDIGNSQEPVLWCQLDWTVRDSLAQSEVTVPSTLIR